MALLSVTGLRLPTVIAGMTKLMPAQDSCAV